MTACEAVSSIRRVEEAEPGYNNWPAEQRARYLEGEVGTE